MRRAALRTVDLMASLPRPCPPAKRKQEEELRKKLEKCDARRWRSRKNLMAEERKGGSSASRGKKMSAADIEKQRKAELAAMAS